MADNMQIEFKSNEENFEKEISGIKSNTLRKVDNLDQRFGMLKLMASTKIYGRIKITCGIANFIRNITDITYWDNYVIISWRPF